MRLKLRLGREQDDARSAFVERTRGRGSTSTGRGQSLVTVVRPVEGPQGVVERVPQLNTTTYVEAQLISVSYGTPNDGIRGVTTVQLKY